MPPYHSSLPNPPKIIGNVPILPLRVTSKGTGTRGPAPPTKNPDETDIVDESLELFKANILFTTFEVQSELGYLVLLRSDKFNPLRLDQGESGPDPRLLHVVHRAMPEAPGQVRQQGASYPGDVHSRIGEVRAARGRGFSTERILREAQVHD